MVKYAQSVPLPKAHFRTTNEMLDEFAWEKTSTQLFETTSNLAEIFEPVEVVSGDLYTLFYRYMLKKRRC